MIAVGKIRDIFMEKELLLLLQQLANEGYGIEKTAAYLNASFKGLLFTNLVDFILYGHRRDPIGYGSRALEVFAPVRRRFCWHGWRA